MENYDESKYEKFLKSQVLRKAISDYEKKKELWKRIDNLRELYRYPNSELQKNLKNLIEEFDKLDEKNDDYSIGKNFMSRREFDRLTYFWRAGRMIHIDFIYYCPIENPTELYNLDFPDFFKIQLLFNHRDEKSNEDEIDYVKKRCEWFAEKLRFLSEIKKTKFVLFMKIMENYSMPLELVMEIWSYVQTTNLL